MSTSSQAGPSRPQASTSRLQVIQRDRSSPSTPINQSTSLRTDASILSKSIAQKEQYHRRSQRYGDKLMETTVSLPTFRTALRYIKPLQFAEILHERHLSSMCSYPTCSNTPREEYRSGKRFRISTSKRTIKEEEGNEREGFCSEGCRVKGEWVGIELDRKGTGEMVDLLEDVIEEKASGKIQGTDGDRIGEVQRKTEREEVSLVSPKQPQVAPTSTDEPQTASSMDPMPNLIIHERPTNPSIAPKPPSLSQTQNTNSIPPNPSIRPPALQSPYLPATSTSRRSHSLLQTPSKLTDSILAQSHRMGPIPQLPPDEEDGDEADEPTGAEFGMDWGEDGDLEGLFQDMRLGLAEMRGEMT